MSESRPGAVGGFVFAASSVAGGALLPKPPAADASGGRLVGYFSAHHQALLAGSALAALAAVALLPFLAALRARIGAGIAGRSAHAGGTALVASAVVGAVLQAGLAQAAPRLTADSLQVGYALERAVFYVSPAFFVIVLGGAATLASRLPTWLRMSSAPLTVVASVAAVSGVLSRSTAATAVGFAGFLLTIAWVVGASVALWQAGPSTEEPVARPARLEPSLP